MISIKKILIAYSKDKYEFWDACPLGKHIKLSFYDSISGTSMPFDILLSNLWTSPVLSSSGHRYYVLFLDNFSNFLWTFPISNKSEVYHLFHSFKNFIKTHFEKDIKNFQCDNDREFINITFHNMCSKSDKLFCFACPNTSPRNGKFEWKIKTINNIVRTMLDQSLMRPTFWHHALEMATYLHNILPQKFLITNHLLKFYIIKLLFILIFECLVVYVTLFSPQIL